jgi:heptosyltransferase-2
MREISEAILIRGVNWIGDAIMTLPAVRAIRKAYPEAHIDLLVKPSVASVFEHVPCVNGVLTFSEQDTGIKGRLRHGLLLRKQHYTQAILLQNAFGAAVVSLLAGIPKRIGYDRDGRGMLLTHPIPYANEDLTMHHVDYYLNLLRQAGLPADYERPFLSVPIHERERARKKLASLKRPILGINPGATYGSAKRWFPDRFAEVANWFIATTGGSVVIFGGKNEEDIALEIDEEVPANKLCLAGRTSLPDLIGLIAECDAFVTNDSGPMHLAYALGTPTVAIFGSTSPELTGPVGEGHRVVRRKLDCTPCFERKCKKGHMKCMDTITPEDVCAALAQIIPKRKAVFFDRDGTLCRDVHYLNNWKDFELFPDIDSLRDLKGQGYLLIGVSNQSGIGRGIVDEAFVREVNQLFIDKYGFDDFFYCPHSPAECCACRKPEPGMLHDARLRYQIDLKQSYVVGDKDADMMLARIAGARGIHVQTGQQETSPHADISVGSLSETVSAILVRGTARA